MRKGLTDERALGGVARASAGGVRPHGRKAPGVAKTAKPGRETGRATKGRDGQVSESRACPKPVPRDNTVTNDAKVEAGKPRQHLQMVRDESKTEHQQLAELSLSPVTRGALVGTKWAEKAMGDIGVNEAVAYVQQKADEAAAGDLTAAKAMLMAQAITLDAMFNEMARKAANCLQINEDGSWSFKADTMEAVTRVAFKAQGQCRATLQTLGELVNPRSVAFIKQAPGSQANVTSGAQQVNNGQPPPQAGQARAGEIKDGTNKLLEGNPSERLDTGAQAAPGGANQVLEAVGAVHRSEDAGGKVRSLPQRGKARAA